MLMQKYRKGIIDYLQSNPPNTEILNGLPKLHRELLLEQVDILTKKYPKDEHVRQLGVYAHWKKSCIGRSKLQLREHQKRVVEHLKKNRGLIVWHGIGTGKTLTAVTASRCILDMYPDIKIIVITPKSLRNNFIKEMKAYGAKLTDNFEFYTQQLFARRWNLGEIDCKNAFIIVDEAHNLKANITETKGKQALAAIECAMKAKKVLLLTATPIMNRENEIRNLVSMVDGESFISDKTFDKRYIERPDFLKNYLECKISYFKIDSDTTLFPEVVSKDVEFYMSDSEYRKYKEVETAELKDRDLLSIFSTKKMGNLKAFYNGVRRAVNIELGKENQKIVWIKKRLQKDPKRKTIIYSQFLATGLRLVGDVLDEIGVPYTIVDGTVSASNRARAVKDYNEGRVNVLLFSSAGGEGLDLKETRDVIILEPAWNEATIEQAIGRASRYKSHINLPKKDQRVNVWRLLYRKPKNVDDPTPSADIILNEISLTKKKLMEGFEKEVQKYSIENNKC